MNDSLNQSQSQQTINESKVPTSPSPAFDRPPELNYNAYMTQYLDVSIKKYVAHKINYYMFLMQRIYSNLIF